MTEKSQLTRLHGENGAWVNGQSCQAVAGWVVDLESVERYIDEVGDPGDCSDWEWWDEDRARKVLAQPPVSFGRHEVHEWRVARNVLEYLAWAR
jgi:hypothetical protein